MKKTLCLAAAITMIGLTGLCYSADNIKTTPQEYFKHAGKPTDPSYQDYVATQAANEAKKRAADEKKKADDRSSYAAQQEKIKERVKNSPKYSVPNFDKKGAYGQAK